MRVKLTISGIVQGVGFRPFIYRLALKYGLTGYVQNRGDAGVEVLVEGDASNVDSFTLAVTNEKPVLAKLDQIDRVELSGNNQYCSFSIDNSSTKIIHRGSVVAPDVAICDLCLKELRDPKNPRFDYFFITCTDCGPRFTLIEKLPYDRENTTMKKFVACSFCQKEYLDMSNRRFHAQTVADSTCGPSVYLTNCLGESVESKDPIRLAAKLLSEGKIVAVKGYGGFHIAASTMLEKPLRRLRAVKHRKEKPFAIMVKNLDSAKNIAFINPKEQELLTSPMRPIVVLRKNKTYPLSSLVAPNLHNIGIMLPYSGLHYLLFDKIADDSFVMTSANAPNQPIIKDNDQALKSLGETVDYFLFYNREIAHRCDDSVMRIHDTSPVFIRRSRGFAPSPIKLKNKSKSCVLGLGGELNNTSTIIFEDKAFISQHIGDIENIETLVFLQQATTHLQNLTNTNAEIIACDLHPKFNTTALAKELAAKDSLPLVQVQHHHAHVAALLAEHGLDQIVAITCDGYGYGSDGSAWGGEILYCNNDSPNFSRLAHLEDQILLGGDRASQYPARLTAAILAKAGIDAKEWFIAQSSLLPYGQTEAELVLDQLAHKTSGQMHTTSCGRVLDAVSALLGLCSYRSYEGEPAMKLESAALGGKDALQLEPKIYDNILNTSCLLKAIYENLGKLSVEDLAYSTHIYLAKGLADLAITHANQYGTKNVGFTGGVACNQILATVIRQSIETAGLKFFVHESIPAGDGGLSFGQAIVGSLCKF